MGGGDRISVVIPWRGGCPHREASLAWLLPRWRRAGHEPILGQAPPGPWSKAAAVADALPRTRADVLVIADADVWCDPIDQALNAVRAGAPWAIPHRHVRRLGEVPTSAVFRGAPLDDHLPLAQPAYRGFEGGGLVVLPRPTYEHIPLDPRYHGWGQEDESWALALRTLAGAPWRGEAPLFHLWHPPQRRDSRRWGSDSSRALYRRYRRASRQPDLMRSLLSEIGDTDRGLA